MPTLLNEITRGFQYIFTQLGPLGGVAVYDTIAPLNSTFPYVIMQLQSPGADVMVVGGVRLMATPLFLVKAIDKTRSLTTLSSLADQIETRLHNSRGITNDARILSCIREAPFNQVDENNGDVFRSLGGMFRLQIQALDS